MLTAKNDGGERIIIPAGTHVARCIGTIDLGTQYNEKFGNWGRKVLIKWELPEELMDDGSPLGASKKYTISLNEKANLRKDLESWLGRSVTEQEEKDGFPLGSLLGRTCLLSIIHAESNGKTYANIAGVMSVPKGTTVPDQSNPAISYDVENGRDAVYAKLPDWVKNIIEESKEFKGSNEPETEEAEGDPFDTSTPFEAEPEEIFVNGNQTFTRSEWISGLRSTAKAAGMDEPDDMEHMSFADLQAAGNIIIKRYHDMTKGKKVVA